MQHFPAGHFTGPVTGATLDRRDRRIARGIGANAWGRKAEDRAADAYQARGAAVLARRWRGAGGEIDLIVRDGDVTVFVEVKKSASHEQAALRLSRRQMDRICNAALEYCDTLPGGALTDMRFDAALVDDAGLVEIVEGAFGEN